MAANDTFKLFRYSGNKTKFKAITGFTLPQETKRIVEPFCGSMGFSLQYNMPAIGLDISSELIGLLNWLNEATDETIVNLKKYEGNKIDVRKLTELSEPEKTYLRINIASVCVGQLSSYTVYPQHKLPILSTLEARKKAKSLLWEYYVSSYKNYTPQNGDFVFIDPPYLGTSGNYNDNSLNLEQFCDWQKNLTVPHIITYNQPIKEIETRGAEWKCWLRKKVPNMRQGGTKIREDWYVSIND